jgi:hypothetical protein
VRNVFDTAGGTKALNPRTRVALPRDGVMATFHLPPTTFYVVVTLDDDSQHRVDNQGAIYTVSGPFKGDLPLKERLPKGCL